MAASYTWHPGADGVAPVWPLSQSLIADELLSSWLVRVALAHGYSPSNLASVVWPAFRIWTQDFDRGIELRRLEVLAAYTGITATTLQCSTLDRVAKLLVNDPSKRTGVWPWVLVLGCRSRFHAGGLQCCPECFTQGKTFYRIQWRLAWHTSCPIHNVGLIDCCQRCHSPLQPGLLQASELMGQCHACGALLGACARVAALPDALAIQQYADQLVTAPGSFGNITLDFTQWMRVARAMISLLQVTARQRSRTLLQFCKNLGVDTTSLTPASLGLPFEYLAQPERAKLLGGAWALMTAGPDIFIHEAKRLALPLYALHVPSHGAPDILIRMVSALKVHSPHRASQRNDDHPRTQMEVLRMWLRLTRRMRRNGL